MRSYLSGANVGQRARGLIEQQIDALSQQILLRQVHAAIGDKLKTRPGDLLEKDSCQVRHAADAGRSSRGLIRMRSQPGDQLLQVVRWQRVARDDDLWITGEERDRF